MTDHLTHHPYKITSDDRNAMKGHRAFLVLFTGLSGAGKSTLANALEERLYREQIHTYVLDGDNIRHGINRNLGFSPEDRSENNRRIGEISKLFIDAGIVVLAAFVSPYEKDRAFIRDTVGPENFIEVFMNTSLKECERRDVKGLYKKARAGLIPNMTGISAPYEKPTYPDVVLTELNTVEDSVDLIYNRIRGKLVK